MKYIFWGIGLMICPFLSIGQSPENTESTYLMPANLGEIEANFLSSYYQQDGNNAAVTGGIGTEKLTDIANIVVVNIPLDSINSVGVYAGADYYTSASTDMIDNNLSSASRKDLRTFATLSYQRLNRKRGESYGAKIGFSTEYDYTSLSGGLSYTKQWNEGNSEITFSGQAFLDNWETFFPRELRGKVSVPTTQRQSYNGQLLFSQVLTKRLQLGLSAEITYMKGLLSTPFHRVYFADISQPDIERLPATRFKIPLGIRFNYYPVDNLILRTYYRYYQDDFGITAHTAEVEVPIKISTILTVAPFFRYYTQTAADYFAPYQSHLSSQEFYTSDYDLSGFNSIKFGVGFKYAPLYGLARTQPLFKNKKVLMLKYIELRIAQYNRNTGLKATIGSLNIGLGLK